MNKIHLLAITLVILIAGVSCDRELDQAPVLTYDGEANMTIEELCALHTVGSADSYSEIPAGTVITGIVTSSDKEGNCYKYLTIQDETGAIMIKVDDSSLDPKYRIGQRIYVECGDMVIGDYRKNKQLGFWVDGAMTGISSSQEDLYLFRDGVCGEEPEATVITSKSQIDESMYNKLVKLEGCHFQEAGSVYCETGANTSRNIVMADNSVIVLRTSNYATFASQLLPEGEGDIYGILTIYNTTPQLVIRSINDVHIGNGGGGGNTTDVEHISIVDLTNDPLTTQGWQEHRVQGDTGWFYYAPTQAFAIWNQNSSAIDSWLISPTINTSNYENVMLELEEYTDLTNGEHAMYYSTNFNGSNFDSANWQQFTTSTNLPSSSSLRIAFRYNCSRNAFWRITKVGFKGTPIR